MAAGATYVPIATQTLGSSASSVTFNSISQGFTDLVVVSSIKPSSSASGYGPSFQINGDTGSNYSYTLIYGNGSSAGSIRASSINYARYGSGGSTSTLEADVTHIMNYSNTTTYKTILARFSQPSADTGAFVNLWRNTAAITSLTFYGNDGGSIAAGSTFTLFGISAA